MQSGRNQDAYRSFLLVRRLYPENWVAPFGLALLHTGSGQQEQARELLEESFRLGGERARNEARNYPVLEGIGGYGP
jgi:Flp pilus assembly protein TadD